MWASVMNASVAFSLIFPVCPRDYTTTNKKLFTDYRTWDITEQT